MMYYQRILEAMRDYRKLIRKFAKECNDLVEQGSQGSQEDQALTIYNRGRRDAYADAASRMRDLINSMEVK